MPMVMLTLNDNFNRDELLSLTHEFESVVRREQDRSLARNLRRNFVERSPNLHDNNTLRTIEQLAKWCKTDGIYYEGMQVARKISRLLFGEVLDREALGV